MDRRKRIIFIGDSITDCVRKEDPEQIGYGYVRLIRDQLIIDDPLDFSEVINKGVGGDRVIDLANRWTGDVINLHPDYVSVSIGINDVWRQLDNPDMEQVYPDQFKKVYYDLLQQVKSETGASLILMEPTIIEEDVHSPGNQKLKDYVQIVRDLADQFDALLVPTHRVFGNFMSNPKHPKLTVDGVHMNSLGNLLMAQTWLKTFIPGK
ncbi:SGNH/GDSL hydrolase family protein [Aquibacillus sediminis]|uniref:SGNH/GDSL hydrolase family protein n=1 Tax=Aquibacillus sediminis TaxID=2574734 RepID=UPI001107E825|nr:SGNH/GDSL hydrolase family protein [Aquibacillus sediminis]